MHRRTTDRGFTRYEPNVTCSYGQEVAVYESSSAISVACWLSLNGQATFPKQPGSLIDLDAERFLVHQAHMAAHLDRAGVLAVVERLVAWLDDHPEEAS